MASQEVETGYYIVSVELNSQDDNGQRSIEINGLLLSISIIPAPNYCYKYDIDSDISKC